MCLLTTRGVATYKLFISTVRQSFLLLKCHPYYLPREFTAVFLATVYIPPQANPTAALGKLHDVIGALETAHPDAGFIEAGDFNHCNFNCAAKIFPTCRHSHPRAEHTGSRFR